MAETKSPAAMSTLALALNTVYNETYARLANEGVDLVAAHAIAARARDLMAARAYNMNFSLALRAADAPLTSETLKVAHRIAQTIVWSAVR